MLDGDHIASQLALLLHDDSIGALRDHGPGEDARRRPRLQRLRHMAGRDALRYFQRRAAAGAIGRPHRIAVHLRIVRARHVHAGDLRRRQHAAVGRQCRDYLGVRHRTHGVQHERLRFGDRQHRLARLAHYRPVLAAM
jgi:hypothetical protein